jgi:hypothetical protein
LKTSLPFFLKQLSKFILLIGFGGLTTKAYSADIIPGIIESYEKLSELHKTQYQSSEKLIGNNLQILSTISNVKDFKLAPHFLRSLLLSSDDKYLSLAQNDECKFYSALENNLLKTTSGEVKSIAITFVDGAGNTQSAAIPPHDFFTELYKKKCFNNKEFTILFNSSNVKKTVEGIKFAIPKTQKDCVIIHKEWLLNSFTSYLCQINKVLATPGTTSADFYRQNISPFHRTYIENLCGNLNSADLFCQNYLKEDIWNKVINGEAPLYKMSYKCKNIFGNSEVFGKSEQAACSAKLISAPQTCETNGYKNYPSIFPFQSCDLISLALAHSKLVTDYQDCPGNIDNEMLTNIHRIINHFDSKSLVTTKDTCASETNYSIAKLNLDAKNETGWPLQICYLERVHNKEECTPYVPGNHAKEERSEDLVVAKILYLQKAAPRKTTCRIISTKTYNPLLSEFKQGCFILFDAESCTNLACNKKVIWNEKVQADIKFIGKPIFDYFSTNYLSERFSLASLINETKGTQSRSIKNLTDLIFYLDKIPGSIIHGVGCAEDLLPEYFSRKSINACHPLPFIIDGHVEKGKTTFIIFRSAVDDIHTPRLVLWQNIFNGVSAYQLLHPLNTWTLDGLKK